jgi:NAD(P)-dependent dehydrogenase (short-subunit alcohol dehydrogenase family)
MDLTNASAIVTGGAGGFGSATVRRLAQKGAKVVIADVSDERGEALAREVGSGSLYVPTDCIDEDAIAKAVKAAAGLGSLRAAVITHIGPETLGLELLDGGVEVASVDDAGDVPAGPGIGRPVDDAPVPDAHPQPRGAACEHLDVEVCGVAAPEPLEADAALVGELQRDPAFQAKGRTPENR